MNPDQSQQRTYSPGLKAGFLAPAGSGPCGGGPLGVVVSALTCPQVIHITPEQPMNDRPVAFLSADSDPKLPKRSSINILGRPAISRTAFLFPACATSNIATASASPESIERHGSETLHWHLSTI